MILNLLVSHFVLLIKLHNHLFLLSGFDGPSADSSYFINSIDSADFPALHQVAGKHRPRTSKTMQTVHRDSLSAGIGLLHYGQESVDLLKCRRTEVDYLDVVEGEVWTGVVVRWFSLGQGHQVFDPVIQQVLIVRRHPRHRQTGHFTGVHPGEVWRLSRSHVFLCGRDTGKTRAKSVSPLVVLLDGELLTEAEPKVSVRADGLCSAGELQSRRRLFWVHVSSFVCLKNHRNTWD